VVRLDRHGHARCARNRLYICIVARSLVSPVLARMGMGGSSPRNDGMRLPDYSLVPTIVKISHRSAGIEIFNGLGGTEIRCECLSLAP
jgi:hypothetical protein